MADKIINPVDKAAIAYATSIFNIAKIENGRVIPIGDAWESVKSAFITGANQGAFIVQEIDTIINTTRHLLIVIESGEYSDQNVNDFADNLKRYKKITGERLTLEFLRSCAVPQQ